MARQFKDLGLSKTVEVQILDNLKTIVRFDLNDAILDNLLVHGLAFFIAAGPLLSPSKKPVVPLAHTNQAFLTLVNPNNKIFNASVPVELFIRDNSIITYIHPKLISLRNSYLELPQIGAYAVPVGGASILVTFFYELFDPAKHKLSAEGELIL